MRDSQEDQEFEVYLGYKSPFLEKQITRWFVEGRVCVDRVAGEIGDKRWATDSAEGSSKGEMSHPGVA